MYDLVYGVLLPRALKIGIDYNSFFHLSPRKFQLIAEGWAKQELAETAPEFDKQAWATGYYVANAIGATFGEGKYPEHPIIMVTPEQQAQYEYEKEKEQLRAWIDAFNSTHFNQKIDEEGGETIDG